MATSKRERFDRLRLSRSENVGPITFRRLLAHFGSAGAAIAALPDLARRGGRGRPIKVCPASTAEREIEALQAVGGRYLIWGDADYPVALANIEDAPPVLSLIGHAYLLERRAVALAGNWG
jgi:DNA processing protein